MQKQNKSFFEQETCLAEIELPAEWRPQFIKWTKKLEKQDKYQEKLRASLEIRNNEYYLTIEDEKDEKQSIRMNISELKQPMNKCNLLIPSPPYDQKEIQNINCVPYKAKAKIENHQNDVEDLQNKFRSLHYSDKQKQKFINYSSSSGVEQSGSEDEFSGFQIPVPFQLSHLEIRDSKQVQDKPIAEVYDKQNLKKLKVILELTFKKQGNIINFNAFQKNTQKMYYSEFLDFNHKIICKNYDEGQQIIAQKILSEEMHKMKIFNTYNKQIRLLFCSFCERQYLILLVKTLS